MKLQLTFKTEEEKEKMLEILSEVATIIEVSYSYTKGQYFVAFVDIE